MLLSFYETHKDDGDRGRKSGRGDGGRGRSRGCSGGRGRNSSGGGSALRKQTPGPPTSRGNDAATSDNTKKLRCTHQVVPAPQLTTHLRASVMLNLFSIANANARRPPALPPFSLLSPEINSGDGSSSSYYSCLSDTNSTDSACLSTTEAAQNSCSFWSCFAPATTTCYVTIDCEKKKSAVFDSGASVDITLERHRTGQLTYSPETVISGCSLSFPSLLPLPSFPFFSSSPATNRSGVRRLQTTLHSIGARPNPSVKSIDLREELYLRSNQN